MSRIAYELAQKLKSVDAAGPDNRLPRSMMLVHAYAMSIPLNEFANAEQTAQEHEPKLKALINKINDYVTVDSRLTCALLRPILQIRFELLNGTRDPLLIKVALESETARELQSVQEQAVSDFLLAHAT